MTHINKSYIMMISQGTKPQIESRGCPATQRHSDAQTAAAAAARAGLGAAVTVVLGVRVTQCNGGPGPGPQAGGRGSPLRPGAGPASLSDITRIKIMFRTYESDIIFI